MADNEPHELDIAQVFVDRVAQELENRDATEFRWEAARQMMDKLWAVINPPPPPATVEAFTGGCNEEGDYLP